MHIVHVVAWSQMFFLMVFYIFLFATERASEPRSGDNESRKMSRKISGTRVNSDV